MYRVDGGRELPERELDAPARLRRVATGARSATAPSDQRQTDVLGEVMIALEHARAARRSRTTTRGHLQRALVNHLAEHWEEPDNGLWEIRGPLRHFTHSRVMVWAAFDRAIRAVEVHGLDGPVERWRELREKVRDEVLTKGFDAERNTFVQHYDTTEVDASLLTLSAVGFLDGDDPRMLGTIAAVERDLMRDGLVLRYRTEAGVDGLSGDEHPFLACSFWLVTAYARAGTGRPGHRPHGPARRPDQRRRPAVRGVRPDRRSAWSATSPRRSRTSPSSGAALALAEATGEAHHAVHADVTLEHVAAETDRVARRRPPVLNDAACSRRPCAPGWSRGHVLTHLARNADALARVCDVAAHRHPRHDVRLRRVPRHGHRAPAPAASADDSHGPPGLRGAVRRAARGKLEPEHAEVRVERTPGGCTSRSGWCRSCGCASSSTTTSTSTPATPSRAPRRRSLGLFLADAVNRLAGDDERARRCTSTRPRATSTSSGDGATRVTGSARRRAAVARPRGHRRRRRFDGPVPTLPFGG